MSSGFAFINWILNLPIHLNTIVPDSTVEFTPSSLTQCQFHGRVLFQAIVVLRLIESKVRKKVAILLFSRERLMGSL